MINDKELIARVVYSKDHYAFATLVKKYQTPIRHFLRRLTAGEHAIADDISQEAFLRIYQKLDTFVGDASFSTWAHKIAYNCFLRAKEKAHYQHEVFDIDLSLFKEKNSEVDRDIMIERLMVHLSSQERTCITLSISAGMSHQEICNVTELPLGTVKSLINRGKQKLMDKINSIPDAKTE